MVSPPHEAMHRIFQEYPGLFTGVSRVLDLQFAPPSSVTVLPTDLTEVRPVERRVDTLLRFDSDCDDPFLLAVEAQGKKDPDKPSSWAYYLSFLNTKYKIPVLLLVVCQDRATAEWATQPVSLSPRQWPALMLRPLVAGPHNMPVITNPDEARADLALATLSAITHAKEPVVDGILKALSTALQDVPEAVADPIIEFTARGLTGNRHATQLWRNLMAVDLSFYKSWLSEEIRDEGRTEARVQTAAEDVLLVLEARGLDVPDEVRERITGCDDPGLLRQWLTRAVTVPSAEEIFMEKGV
ncbi:hypothetical protein [Streptomyces sp. PSKA30]|uniref:hypothetical protein n=1 Tax=Streptomyces sp. PSKA30 TaxID=2874597 RepID=UPI001CD15E9F|nr:hypothetical protein [Streptomyces sp. PSKA30]MBZ9639246.1 hypothetical protein [Streptomyces sp. PSKA30]